MTEQTKNKPEEEEKFFKPKPKEQLLQESVEFLEDAQFKFTCFVSAFKRYLIKAEILEKGD